MMAMQSFVMLVEAGFQFQVRNLWIPGTQRSRVHCVRLYSQLLYGPEVSADASLSAPSSSPNQKPVEDDDLPF